MIRTSFAFLMMTTAAAADDLTVVTDIPPVQAMVSAVMGGAPEVLVPAGASPHDFALAPSQARDLSNADLVVWVGPQLSPWLADPLATLAPDATTLVLLDLPGVELLPMREGGHDHGHDDHGHDDHDHDAQKHDNHDHDDHDHDAEGHDDHAHDAEGHEDHDHAKDDAEHAHDDHAHDGDFDPHAWLDPDILTIWAGAVADALAAADPDNAATYAANAEAYAVTLADNLAGAAAITGLQGVILPHDGFQYLESRLGFEPVGYVTDGHDADPGPAHLAELRALVTAGEVTCILHGPGAVPGWVGVLTEGADITTGEIDPLAPFATTLAALGTCAS